LTAQEEAVRTLQATAAAPRAQQAVISWKRVIAAGFLSEVAVIIVISLVIVAYRFVIVPGRTGDEYSEFGQNAGYYISGPAAAVAVFVFALWALGSLESGFILNGLLVGIVATLLTIGFLAGARPGDRWMYVATFVLRIAAGYAAAVVAQKRKERQ
jgi:hypothetical protein